MLITPHSVSDTGVRGTGARSEQIVRIEVEPPDTASVDERRPIACLVSGRATLEAPSKREPLQRYLLISERF